MLVGGRVGVVEDAAHQGGVLAVVVEVSHVASPGEGPGI